MRSQLTNNQVGIVFAVRMWSNLCICSPDVVELVRSNLSPDFPLFHAPSPAIADTSDHNTPGHWTSCVFSLMKLYNDESQRNVANIQYSALLIDLSPQFWNNEKNKKCEMRADPSPSSEVWVQFLYKIQNMLIRVVRLRR